MLNPARRLALAAPLIPLISLGGLVVTAGPSGAAVTETMPLYRVQVRISTGTDAGAGTTGRPSIRFNETSTGVRTVNPRSVATGPGGVLLQDVRLFDTPAQMRMLNVGVSGTDPWCIRRVELLLNGRVAFGQDAVPNTDDTQSTRCRSITGGTLLSYSSATLRTNPAWTSYLRPTQPTSMSANMFAQMVTAVTGSAMLSNTPGVAVRWDTAVPVTIERRSSTTLGVSYEIIYNDLSGVEPPNKALIRYDVRLFVGGDGNLHAAKTDPSCCYHYTMSDAAVAQIDSALSRMSARPRAPIPLRFAVDSLKNINWS